MSIIYRGEEFKVFISRRSVGLVVCTPLIYFDGEFFGIGISYEGDEQFFIEKQPRDIVAAWRSTEMLPLLESMNDDSLSLAYYAGFRNHYGNERIMEAKRLIRKEIKKIYNDIFSIPVPPRIIEVFEEHKSSLDNNPILEERKKGLA